MKVIRVIDKPVAGERVLATLPPLEPIAAGAETSARRLNFFTGRALSHLALTREQRSRMAAAARLARAVAPGLVEGLEVALEGAGLALLPGRALTDAAEDVELKYPLRVDPQIVPIDSDSLVARLAPAGNAADDAIRERLKKERLTLAQLREAGRLDLVPQALVLVAEPATIAIDRTGELDSPCPNAVNEGAYSLLAWEDGFRLLWVPWPLDTSLPPWTSDGTTIDAKFRNRLAYAVFNRERAGGVRWPWDDAGAPLAVVGFDAAMQPVFADRNAVVRQGGGRVNRAPLVRGAGDDVLWQARFAQLVEHLAELDPAERAAAPLALRFDWLPPAGVLPKDTLDVPTGRQLFFPATFDVQAQPVPLDMVDALIAEAAPLAPFNLSVRDQVQMLVPVPARFFDPDLLKLDVRVHPLFDAEIVRLERLRLDTMLQRDRLRRRFDALSRAIGGRLPAYPQDDPDALPDETGALDAAAFVRVHVSAVAQGQTSTHAFRGAQAFLELAAADELFVFVRFDARPASITLRAAVGDAEKKLLFWGDGDPPAGAVKAGPLPDAGGWARLSVPVATAELSATKIDGLAFGVTAGGAAASTVLWGYTGKLANGYETYWVTDALPSGARTQDLGEWVWQERGAPSADGSGVADAANGVGLDGHARVLGELDTLVQSYTAYRGGVLQGELGVPTVSGQAATPSPNPPVAGAGLDELIGRLDVRIAAANDHVEFGFLRARTDIYRLRQDVLGIGSAGRLLTSPAAAELITRTDNPVATEKDFSEYFKRAAQSVPPTGASPAPAAPIAPAAAPAAAAPAPVPSAVTRNAALVGSSRIVGAIAMQPSATVLAPSTRAGAINVGAIGVNPGATVIGTGSVAASAGPSAAAVALSPGIVGGGLAATPVSGVFGVDASVIARAGSATASPARLALDVGTTLKEVTGTSLYGATLNTITVGERLTGSAAVVTKNAAASGKSDFVKAGTSLLADKGFAIDDLPVFGYKAGAAGAADLNAKSLLGNKLDDTDAEEIVGTDVAESVYFQRGLDAIDNMVRFLRGVEVRVEDYRRLRADAAAARGRVVAALQRVEAQIGAFATALAEARHDLAVARSLRAEELERVATLIARRKAILAEHVPYVVYRRPRLTKVLLDAPVRPVEPAVVEDVVPRCRADTHGVPAEIAAMVDTLKDVPAVWLRRLEPLILKFDHLDKLQKLLGTATRRITLPPPPPSPMLLDGAQTKTGMLLASAFERQTQRVAVATVKQASALSLIQADNTWKSVAQVAVQAVSASDLLHGGAADKHITLEASGELDDIAGVASCLYNAFCGVPPATRLQWAERFSQNDPDVSLRVLTALPGFGDERLGVDYITWKQMQRMVDWLFSRVADEPAAIAAINDLVQVALLLAAHAPVKRIISARVKKPVRPVLGARLDLAIDPRLARIGMQVLVHAPTGNLPIARGVVEDLVADGVVAKLAQVSQPSVTIDASMRVQLQAAAPLTTPATAARDAAPAAASKGDMLGFRDAGRAALAARFAK